MKKTTNAYETIEANQTMSIMLDNNSMTRLNSIFSTRSVVIKQTKNRHFYRLHFHDDKNCSVRLLSTIWVYISLSVIEMNNFKSFDVDWHFENHLFLLLYSVSAILSSCLKRMPEMILKKRLRGCHERNYIFKQ